MGLRAAATLIALAGSVAAAGAAMLVYPDPLFRNVLAQGDLELRSDRLFDADAGRALLADMAGRLDRSPFGRPSGKHRIFIANTAWRERLVFLWSFGAGGVNYYPLTSNVFLRRADVTNNVLFGPSGRPAVLAANIGVLRRP